jgi:RNA polymerase sigma-70 factor (ECF subfamily)
MKEELSRTISIRLLKIRDKDTIKQWFNEFADRLYTIVYYRTGRDSDLAADIVQQTFATALLKIKEYQPARGDMLTWLISLSRNVTKKMLKEKNRQISLEPQLHSVNGRLFQLCSAIDTHPLPADIIEQAELADLVRRTLGLLPERYRKALRQYYYEQSSIEQIAKDEHLSQSAVRILLYRARKAFKKHLLKSAKSIDQIDLY